MPHPVQHTDANDFVTLASWTSASCRRTVYTVYDEVLRRRQTTSPKCHTVGRRQLRHSSFFFLRFPLMPFCAGDQSFPPSTPTPAGRSREVRAVSRGVPVFVYVSLTLDELAVQWRIRVETRRRPRRPRHTRHATAIRPHNDVFIVRPPVQHAERDIDLPFLSVFLTVYPSVML